MCHCEKCKNSFSFEKMAISNDIVFAIFKCPDCSALIEFQPTVKVPELAIVKLILSTGLEPGERKFLKSLACRTPTNAENLMISAIQAKVNPASDVRGIK